MTKPGQIKKPGRPRKWKVCPECGRNKRIEPDFYTWAEYRGRPRISRLCKVCTRERSRQRYARVKVDPYLAKRERQMNAARQRRYAARSDKNAERCRRYREKLKAERPEAYQRMLEDARIRTRLAQGDTSRPPKWTLSSFPETDARRLLPTAPLVAFMDPVDLAVLGRRLSDMYSHVAHREHVTVPVADQIITRAGGALANVYPELYL